MNAMPCAEQPVPDPRAESTDPAPMQGEGWPEGPHGDVGGPSIQAWERGWPETVEQFELLVEAFQDRLVRYAWRRLGDQADAEDAVQEVFVRAFADRSKRRNIARVGPYLYRSVANACAEFQRKRARRRHASLEEVDLEAIPGGGRSPSESAAAAEETRRVEGLLRRLPKKQAEVIRLRVLEEMRLREIAAVVGCSMDTVSSRLRRAFRKLRKMVARERG